MITNKDVRIENGNIVINGDKYPLDGQSPEAIMQIVEDNSDTTPTAESTVPVQSGGVFSAIDTLNDTLSADTLATGNYQATSGNFEYTGVSFTCPEGKTAIVYGQTSYANTKPIGLAFSGTNTALNVLCESTNVGNYVVRTPALMIVGGETVYLWDKRESAASAVNPFIIKGIVIG